MFVICYRVDPIGIIQRYRLADHVEWSETIRATGIDVEHVAGVDYMIGVVDVTGRGIGSAAIDRFTDMLFRDYRDVSAVLAAPQQGNVPSWRALEKAGYTRVWSGELDSDSPSDVGPAFVYRRSRD
jgi:aminoglycoside 6'-N-acetyltransferase